MFLIAFSQGSGRWVGRQRPQPLALALIAMLIGVGAADAGPLDDASSAFKREDYKTALAIWQPLAEQGNAEAERGLGVLYENGAGVPKDASQAVAWFRKAAAQGNADATFRLGERYVSGTNGIARDTAQGLALMTKAFDEGEDNAAQAIGDDYRTGLYGFPKDLARAADWFRKGAERGEPRAEGRLSTALEFGLGVPQETAQARMWHEKEKSQYQVRAEQGDMLAQVQLAGVYEFGYSGVNGVGQQRDLKTALFWYQKAAQQDGPLKRSAIDSVARVEREIKSAGN